MPPKWFWPVLAVCLAVLTAAAVTRLRWRQVSETGFLDTWRNRLCVPEGCIPLVRSSVVTASRSPLYDAYQQHRALADTAQALMDTVSAPR